MSSVNDQPSIVSRQDSPMDNALSKDIIKKREAFVRLLESWYEEDVDDQRETLKLLQHAAEYPISIEDEIVGV